MSKTIAEVLADGTVTQAELDALMNRFDTNGDGQLEGEELRAFAREVAPMVQSSEEDLLAILDFYQLDDDPAISPDELRGFLEVHL